MKKYFIYVQEQDFTESLEDCLSPLEYYSSVEAENFSEVKEKMKNSFLSFVDEDDCKAVLFYAIDGDRIPCIYYNNNFLRTYLKTTLQMGYKLSQIENRLNAIDIDVDLDFEINRQ